MEKTRTDDSNDMVYGADQLCLSFIV